MAAREHFVRSLEESAILLKTNRANPNGQRYYLQALSDLASVCLELDDATTVTVWNTRWRQLMAGRARELYNGACAIARHLPARRHFATEVGVADQSILTLREASAAGWTNWAHTAVDPDLRSLYSRPDFQELAFDRVFPRDAFAR